WVFQNPGGPTRTGASTRAARQYTTYGRARTLFCAVMALSTAERARKRAAACAACRTSRVRLLAVAHICPHSRTASARLNRGLYEVGEDRRGQPHRLPLLTRAAWC